MAQAAQKLHARLLRGDDCVEEVRRFVAEGSAVPDALVLATIGNRNENVAPCPRSLRLLLEARGNPDAVDPLTTAPALHAACWHGSVEVVKALLDNRADIEVKETRMKTPPLNTALAAGNAKVALELLNRLCDVQWRHHDGATALHVATAWIASSHNAGLRIPPTGEEPRAVVAMMLHNGVDPLQTEGMTKSATRGSGMTPLEAFRRDVALSPWRSDPKFDRSATMVHKLLEQAEQAMRNHQRGNAAFKERRFEDALQHWEESRKCWESADVRGHHSAVSWSNAATCFRKMEDVKRCRHACEQGKTHYCAAAHIRAKLDTLLKECDEGFSKPEVPAEPKPPPTKLKERFLESTGDQTLYPPEGSVQGKVENPGPFICHFEDAKEAGFVDGVPGWRERAKMEEEELDKELVAKGLMSPDLLST